MEFLTDSNGNKFNIYISRPSSIKGAIILIHEVWGLVEHIKNIADRYANEGYLVLAPELIINEGFSNDEIKHLQECIFDPLKRDSVQTELRRLMAPINEPSFNKTVIDKLNNCFSYLNSDEQVKGKIAIMGFCFGGTSSYSFSCVEPRLKLAMPFYGHANFSTEEIGNIKCPIRAFYGINDTNLIEGLEDLKYKMEQANIDYQSIVYDNCAHAFFNDTNKYAFNDLAAKDAWNKSLGYLEQFLV